MDNLKSILAHATGCTIQHDGWTCGTCFFALSDKLNNQDWQAVLLVRGDYKESELDNLPQSVDKAIKKVERIAGKVYRKNQSIPL